MSTVCKQNVVDVLCFFSRTALFQATTHSPTTEAAQSDHLDFLKNMTTSDLAQVVLSNCRLTQYLQPAKQSNIKNAATIVQESYANTATGSWNKTISILEKIVSKVRQKKNYRVTFVSQQDIERFVQMD